MTGNTPPKKLSEDFLNAFNKAAFKGSAREIKKAFIECDYEELISMFPQKQALYVALKDIALNERADTFRAILFKFKTDEGCLRAILDGFEADEKYARNHHSDSWGADPDPKDLEAKRAAMRDLAIELNRGAKAQNNTTAHPPTVTGNANTTTAFPHNAPKGPRFG